jgi:hypothetical protein
MVAGGYLFVEQMKRRVVMMICDAHNAAQHDVFVAMVLQSK